MLSDVLFEAMQDIEFYQEAYPDLYDHYREELEVIKTSPFAIEKLRKLNF